MINDTNNKEQGRRVLPSMTSPMAQLGRAIAVASSSSASSTSFLFNPLNELRQAAQSGFNSARKNISENKDAKKAKAVFCASMSAAQYNSKHNNNNNNRSNKNAKEIMVPIRGSNNKFLGAMIPGDSAVEVVLTSGLFSTLNIYNTLLIGRLIVTWFPAAPQQIVYPLATICDPYLNLFRGIIPPLGGLDLSPILAFTALNFFTSTAAALPAQIDGDGNIVGVPEKKNVFKGLFAEKKKEEKR
jgi:uncharacterized protein YggT (Ycf19 family)